MGHCKPRAKAWTPAETFQRKSKAGRNDGMQILHAELRATRRAVHSAPANQTHAKGALQLPSTDSSQKETQVGRDIPVIGSTPGTVLVQVMRT